MLPHTEELLSALHKAEDVDVTIITGKNRSLYRSLSTAYPRFEIIGFNDRVADHMARADLLLTKAGGITTFEAIRSGTPLCLLRPFLIQEEENADMVRRSGFGVVLEPDEDEARQVLTLLRDRNGLADMKQRMAVALRSMDQITALDRFYACQEAVC